MGTLVEDIVFPGIATSFRALFPERELLECGLGETRRHATNRGRTNEFDSIATAGDVYLVVETKGRFSPADVDELPRRLAEVRDYFPEARDRRVFGALASYPLKGTMLILGLGLPGEHALSERYIVEPQNCFVLFDDSVEHVIACMLTLVDICVRVDATGEQMKKRVSPRSGQS